MIKVFIILGVCALVLLGMPMLGASQEAKRTAWRQQAKDQIESEIAVSFKYRRLLLIVFGILLILFSLAGGFVAALMATSKNAHMQGRDVLLLLLFAVSAPAFLFRGLHLLLWATTSEAACVVSRERIILRRYAIPWTEIERMDRTVIPTRMGSVTIVTLRLKTMQIPRFVFFNQRRLGINTSFVVHGDSLAWLIRNQLDKMNIAPVCDTRSNRN